LILSILGSLALLHYLAAMAMGEITRSTVWRSAVLLTLVVVLMSGTLRRTRAISARQATPDVESNERSSIESEATDLVSSEESADVERRDSTE